MTTIAVLGANGRLSRTVAKAFLAAGHHVIAISRTGKPLPGLPGARFVAADAMGEADLIRATEGADIIFNGLNPLYTEWDEKALPLTRNALAAARAHGATQLFPGNVYGYGNAMPQTLLESTPQHPTTRKGEIRVEMEALFRAAADKDGVQTIIIRAGDFFGGDGKGTWLDQGLAAKLGKGIFTHPGNPSTIHAFAYLPDLAGAFVAAAARRSALGRFETFNFDGHNITTADLQAVTEKIVGRKLKPASMPWAMIRLMGLVWPMGREIARMSYLWDVPHELKSERFDRLIGPVPRTPLEDAMKQALKDQGLLDGPVKMAA